MLLNENKYHNIIKMNYRSVHACTFYNWSLNTLRLEHSYLATTHYMLIHKTIHMYYLNNSHGLLNKLCN